MPPGDAYTLKDLHAELNCAINDKINDAIGPISEKISSIDGRVTDLEAIWDKITSTAHTFVRKLLKT